MFNLSSGFLLCIDSCTNFAHGFSGFEVLGYWLILCIYSCTNFAKSHVQTLLKGLPETLCCPYSKIVQVSPGENFPSHPRDQRTDENFWFDMSASCFNGTTNGNTWGGPDTWSAPRIDHLPPPLSSESTDHSPRWLKIGNPILVFCENLVDDLYHWLSCEQNRLNAPQIAYNP